MFIGRQKELQKISEELSNSQKKTAILIYGKRRVGKSTLIKEAAKTYIQKCFGGTLSSKHTL